MSEWISKENVEIQNVFRKIPANHNEYLIQLRIPGVVDQPLGESRHTIIIWESDLLGQLKGVFEGTREKSYLAYGNQGIDFYRNKEGKFTIRHSPFEGLNLVFTLADGQFERLIEELSTDRPYAFFPSLQAAGVQLVNPKEQIRIIYKISDNRAEIARVMASNGFEETSSNVEGESVVSTWERVLNIW